MPAKPIVAALALLALGAASAAAQQQEQAPRQEPRPPLTAMEALQDMETESRQQLRRAQRALADAGYDPGPVDGVMGPRTRRAVRAWQRDHGLEPDGEVTPEFLQRLAEGAPPREPPLTSNERRLQDAARLRPYVLGVQAELRQHGFFVGPQSGRITPHLREAIRAYERQASMEPSGEVNQALLDHLRFARPEVMATLPD